MEPLNRAFSADPCHFLGRRDFLKLGAIGAFSWLTPASQLLARMAEKDQKGEPAQSIILLWMAGGPSQIETFDPHPGTLIGGDTHAIDTAIKGCRIAEGYANLAEVLGEVALVRSVVSKEGDHERGTYLMKTGYRPDPTVIHPSIGAVCCHELPIGATELPRHVSILPNQWPGRGGFLGDEYDAFKTFDPIDKVPDVTPLVDKDRDAQRVRRMDVVEQTFAKGRLIRSDATLHRAMVQNARKMMTSEQLKAFDVQLEPESLRKQYGDTPFGRGCLAARRLIEVGVRCVEVTLDGWDSHANNAEICRNRAATLDPAFAALIKDLKQRDLLRKTVVLCCGEFGRTPSINPLGGRDHWPKGFSVAIAGGGIRGGQVIGATDPEGKKDPVDPRNVADVHATVLAAVGIETGKTLQTNIGRTVKLSEGKVMRDLLVG